MVVSNLKWESTGLEIRKSKYRKWLSELTNFKWAVGQDFMKGLVPKDYASTSWRWSRSKLLHILRAEDCIRDLHILIILFTSHERCLRFNMLPAFYGRKLRLKDTKLFAYNQRTCDLQCWNYSPVLLILGPVFIWLKPSFLFWKRNMNCMSLQTHCRFISWMSL